MKLMSWLKTPGVKALGVSALAAGLAAAADSTPTATFHKDVVPILQARCQGCHRPGEIGPMPLLTYKDARPWAKAMKEAVLSRKMPPWFADAGHGRFANDRSLAKTEVDVLTAWADSGAREGKPHEAPSPRSFSRGWNIPPPDLVLEMPEAFAVPESGRVEYTYIVLPHQFSEDRWVQMAEARPGSGSLVHHMTVYVRDPESKWLREEARPGVPFTPPKSFPDGRRRTDLGGMGNEILFFFVPGYDPATFAPGQAKKIRAGSDLVLEMHYTPNGKAVADRSRIGLVFATEPVRERVIIVSAGNNRFVIPPGDPNYRVDGAITFRNHGKILSLYPHMHLRGKGFEFRLVHADGRVETLLKLTRYSFNWQLDYRLETPVAIAPGMKMECTAWYDNSANNPLNPDPRAEVRYGEMSWEEMAGGVMQVAIDARLTPREWFTGKQPESAAVVAPSR